MAGKKSSAKGGVAGKMKASGGKTKMHAFTPVTTQKPGVSERSGGKGKK